MTGPDLQTIAFYDAEGKLLPVAYAEVLADEPPLAVRSRPLLHLVTADRYSQKNIPPAPNTPPAKTPKAIHKI